MRPDPNPPPLSGLRRAQAIIAIAGAIGAVGKKLLQILDRRRFPPGELRRLTSPRSAGRRLAFAALNAMPMAERPQP